MAKDELGYSRAKLVYDTTLRLSGTFLELMNIGDHREYVKKLQNTFLKISEPPQRTHIHVTLFWKLPQSLIDAPCICIRNDDHSCPFQKNTAVLSK